MTIERYHEICNHLDPSLASLLNLIRQYLQANQASVMVGAGFSKNADLLPGAEMKDWNELAVEFYKHLYASSTPADKNLVFKSPIRLASQYASYISHAELDKVISNSLPDKSVNPGTLHKKLMRLPWRDVFTTNYDTLLERTRSEWNQHYDVVTNRNTLIYSKSPRIIKLHGSFPDQHPFIITEEDFRTYPKDHPEFVNTVRQSLIENLFCLIGFSGDDENFLSWIGWLRDVIGKESVLCYLVTYNKNLHDSEIKLMVSRGITPINLKRLPLKEEEGYADALDFFLTYIAPRENSQKEEWNGVLADYPYDDLIADTVRMEKIRTTYPGWPFLPSEHLADFKDIARRAPFIGAKFKVLTDDQKFKFAKEILWRIQISYSPLKFEWLNEYIESLISESDIRHPEITEMALELLSSYRRDGDYEKFEDLYNRIEDIEEWGTSLQIHRCRYEAALCYISMLNLPALKGIVSKWNVSEEETIPILWKTNILSFLGDINEAKVLLEASIQHLTSQFRNTSSSPNEMLLDISQTSLYAISGIGEMRSSNTPSLYISYTEKLKMYLLNYEKNGKPGQQVEHSFNIGRKVRSWRSGTSGYYGDYIYPYRYLTMREQIGFPMGTMQGGIDTENLRLFLEPFIKYEPAYATSCAIRSMSSEIVKTIYTREILHYWEATKCVEIYDSSFHEIFENPKTKTEERIQRSVLLPLFSRMCIRFNHETYIRNVFNVVIKETQKHPRRYDLYREELGIIYDCASEDSKAIMIQECLRLAIPEQMTMWDVPMPTCYLDRIDISNDIVNSLSEALGDVSRNKEKVVRRILKIYRWLSDEQRNNINTAILAWRKDKNDFISISTYEEIHISDDEREDVTALCERMVSLFEQTKWENDEASTAKDNILEWMNNIIHLRMCLTHEMVIRIYTHLCEILPSVYQIASKTNVRDVFGREDYYQSKFDHLLRCLVHETSELIIGESISQDFIHVAHNIDKTTAPLQEVILKMQNPIDIQRNPQILKTIKSRLLSKQRSIREDGVNSMIYLMKYYSDKDCETNIMPMISFMRETSEDRLTEYIKYCIDFLLLSNHDNLANRYRPMLQELMKVVEDKELPFEFRTDVCYYAGRLAGVMGRMSLYKRDVIEEWEQFINDSGTDTDVKNSIESGKLLYFKYRGI